MPRLQLRTNAQPRPTQRLAKHQRRGLRLRLVALLVAATAWALPAWADSNEHAQLLGDPGGLRSAAESRGLGFDATLVGDYSYLLDGGENPRASAARYLAQAGLALDTQAAFGWQGGTLRAVYAGLRGDNGNLDTGDAQTYSNIDEAPFDALYLLWYRQVLFDERLAVTLGKMDANADFAYVDNGAAFINSSPGFSPTVQGFPSYPDPASGVNVFLASASGHYAGVGVYDGATQAGISTGTRGPDTFFGVPSDLFYIAEAGLRYTLGTRDGRVGLGYWQHTGDFERFDGATDDGTDGAYAVFDQSLYESPDSPLVIGAFAQYGYADEGTSAIKTHVSTGVQAGAVIAGRSDDVTGLMASYVAFSDAPAAGFRDDYELAIEAFHAFQISGWLVLRPDFQYIVNPGGMGLDDATVVTLRAEIAL